MATKKLKAPPGRDYDPVTGANPNISYGTVEAGDGKSEQRRRLEDVIFARLYPTEKPDPALPWINPTAQRWDVLLPRGASDDLLDPKHLCRAYHAKNSDQIQHLATVVSIRFPEADEAPQRIRVHEAYELARGFGRHLSDRLSVAMLVCLHIPGRSWGHGVPHCHLVIPPRILRPGSGFTTFVMSLINPDEGRAFIDAEWETWRKVNGYGD